MDIIKTCHMFCSVVYNCEITVYGVMNNKIVFINELFLKPIQTSKRKMFYSVLLVFIFELNEIMGQQPITTPINGKLSILLHFIYTLIQVFNYILLRI